MTTDMEILTLIAEGKSLRSICRENDLSESTVRLRFRSDDALAAQYASAREAQADHYAERIVDEALTATDASIGRLKMDALKWAASKMAPKRYGDKLELSGHVDTLTPEARAARIAALKAKLLADAE